MQKEPCAEKAHAKYSASASKRWLTCAGSVGLALSNHPLMVVSRATKKSNPRADEGTRAHGVLEYLVNNRKKRKAAIAFLLKKHPEEMVNHAIDALDYIESRLEEYPHADLEVETQCDLPVTEEDQFGTTDVAIVEHFGRLIVADYKYGAGIYVDVEENSQLLYYALGLAHKYHYNFAEVELVIIQPRLAFGGKTIRSWVTSVDTLLEWRDKFEKGIQLCKKAEKLGPEKFLVSGDHCQFCPAKIICPENKNKALREAQIDFDDDADFEEALVPDKSKVPSMNLKLDRVLPAVEKLKVWIKAVEEYATEYLESGGKIPGWGLVPKRGQRKWNHYEKAAAKAKKLYGDPAFTKPELLSPPQLEKVKGLAFVEGFIETHSVSVSSGFTLGKIEEEKEGVKTKTKKAK